MVRLIFKIIFILGGDACFQSFPRASTPLGGGRCDAILPNSSEKCGTKHHQNTTIRCVACSQVFGFHCIGGCKNLKDASSVVSPFLCHQCLPLRDMENHRMSCKKCNALYWLIWDMLNICAWLAHGLKKLPENTLVSEDLEECKDFIPYRLQKILRLVEKTLAHKMCDDHQTRYKCGWFRNLPQNVLATIEDYLGKLGGKNLFTVTCQEQGKVISAHMTCAFMAQPDASTYAWYRQNRPDFDFVGVMGEHDPALDGSLILLTFSTFSDDMNQDTYHQVSHRTSIRKVVIYYERKNINLNNYNYNNSFKCNVTCAYDIKVIAEFHPEMDHIDLIIGKSDGAAVYTCTQACQLFKESHNWILDKEGNQRFKSEGAILFRSVAGEGKDQGDGAGGVVSQKRNVALKRGLESNTAEQLTSVLMAVGMPGNVFHVEIDRTHDVTTFPNNKVETIAGIGNHLHWQCEEGGVRIFKVSGIGKGLLITNDELDAIYPKQAQGMPSFTVDIPSKLSSNCTAFENKLQGSSAMDMSKKVFSMSTTHSLSHSQSSIPMAIENAANGSHDKGKKRCSSEDAIEATTDGTMLSSIPQEENGIENMQISGEMPFVLGTNTTKNQLERKKKKQERDLRVLSRVEAENQQKAIRASLTAKTRERLGLADNYPCSIEGCDQTFESKGGRLRHENHCTGPAKKQETLVQVFDKELRNKMLLGNNSSSETDPRILDHSKKPLDWIVTISRYVISISTYINFLANFFMCHLLYAPQFFFWPSRTFHQTLFSLCKTAR